MKKQVRSSKPKFLKTAFFVDASDLFKDLSALWDVFICCDPKCSWGDNNRTLITQDVITAVLDDQVDEPDEDAMTKADLAMATKLWKQYDAFKERVATATKELKAFAGKKQHEIYIDLEN